MPGEMKGATAVMNFVGATFEGKDARQRDEALAREVGHLVVAFHPATGLS